MRKQRGTVAFWVLGIEGRLILSYWISSLYHHFPLYLDFKITMQ